MNELKGKRVIIFQQRGWGRGIGRFLAKKLTAEGCKLAALTFKNTTHHLIANQEGVEYEMLLNNDWIMSRPKDYLDGDRYSLQEICKALNIDSIWPIVSTLRNHVKSYRDKYYYAFKQNVSDEEIIDFIMATYKYTKAFFTDFKPDVIIVPNFVSFPHILFKLYAEQKGVPMFSVADTKIPGHYMFIYGYNADQGPFFDRVDELNNDSSILTKNRDKAKKYIAEFRDKFKKSEFINSPKKISFLRKVRKELSPFWQCLKWPFQKHINVLESTGITIDYRPPKIMLRDHFYHKKYKKFTNNFEYYPFDKIKKFVYFPLQFQPEAIIDVICPRFSNQLETARQVAMSLPDDYVLVVKEHPAMVGLRSPSYLEKIARTANIKLIDYRISSEEVLKKADLVASPSGSTIVEAAYLNKPVIQLGNLGTTLKLPNVFKHTNMTTLPAKIKEVLSVNLNTAEYERRLENFVAAVFDAAFDFNYMKAWVRGTEDLEKLWIFYKKELIRLLIHENNTK